MLSLSTRDTLGKLLLLPLYVAVREWVPSAIPLVVNDAVPLFTGTVPRTVNPDRKVIVPVGGNGPVVVTVAVKVTDWPASAGFELEVRTVWVEARETSCKIIGETLPAREVSPP
jgi:hypothetical protein